MEPHASLAVVGGRQAHDPLRRRSWSTARTIRSPRRCKLPLENVEVISEFVGGGFGGKLPIYADAILAALAARELKRPVRSRSPASRCSVSRPIAPRPIQRVRLAAARDGKLTAIAHECWSQSARADEYAEAAAASATRSLYAAPNRLTSHRVARARPAGGRCHARAGRGGRPARARAGDGRARLRARLDPVELRMRNEPSEDPEKHVPFSTRALVPACRKARAGSAGTSGRACRAALRDGHWLIGIGMAAAIRGNILRPRRGQGARWTRSAHAVVEMDMTDIGTGSYTIFAQIAAERSTCRSRRSR